MDMSIFEQGIMDSRKGDWMQTWSGRKFWPLDPRPEDVHLGDIANALARICRFGGHVTVPHYSVAQHSVLVSDIARESSLGIVMTGLRAVALMHDAAEAYIGDMIRPLKIIPGFSVAHKEAERKINQAIDERFGLAGFLVDLPRDVKNADNIALATERRDLMAPGPSWGALPLPPRLERIDAMGAEAARDMFLCAAYQCGLGAP